MKGMFRRFFRTRETWCLEDGDFTENTLTLENPARGWYHIYTFTVENEPDLETLKYCLKEEETLALVLLHIGAFRNQELSEESLLHIRKILGTFREHQKDIILRVTYDNEGKALEREPSLFSMVKCHLMQLSAVIQEFGSSIFVFQGMLIGSWGEMHSSRYLKVEQLKQLTEILKKCKSSQTYLAVRRPMYWRMLHQPGGDTDIVSSEGMGLYDDGMFGSESDLGTFGVESRENVSWDKPWNRVEELAFEEKLCEEVPNGGEAVYQEDYIMKLSQTDILNDLKQMHVTYLNKAHDVRLLRHWKDWTYKGADVWNGKSVYAYIGSHMGYRFLIKGAMIESVKTEADKEICKLEIEIENVGFANLYHEAELYIEWIDKNGQQQQKLLYTDMRKWKSGEVQRIAYRMEACESRVYLWAKRKLDGRQIYFANDADARGRVCIGFLRKQGR